MVSVGYDAFSPFTFFIPIDVWVAMFTLTWKDMDVWFMWYFPWAFGLNTLVGLFLDIKQENDWGILWN